MSYCPKCIGGRVVCDQRNMDTYCVNCGWRPVRPARILQTGARTAFAEEHPTYGKGRDGYHRRKHG